MFWFVTIFLFVTICAGAIGLAMGIRLLKFGEEAVGQQHTLRIVVLSFSEILVGGFALAALATKVVDPLVALIVALGSPILLLLWFPIKSNKK
ncbi:MAG: hypothetical protein ACR2H4_19740 [Pyrinomonadaceae bacterium]